MISTSVGTLLQWTNDPLDVVRCLSADVVVIETELFVGVSQLGSRLRVVLACCAHASFRRRCFQPLLKIFQRQSTRVNVPEPSVLRTLAASTQSQAQTVKLGSRPSSTSLADVSQQVSFRPGHLSSLVPFPAPSPVARFSNSPLSTVHRRSVPPLPSGLQLGVATSVFLTEAVVFPALPCVSLHTPCAVRQHNAAAPPSAEWTPLEVLKELCSSFHCLQRCRQTVESPSDSLCRLATSASEGMVQLQQTAACDQPPVGTVPSAPLDRVSSAPLLSQPTVLLLPSSGED